jgi:hypothetical protein
MDYRGWARRGEDAKPFSLNDFFDACPAKGIVPFALVSRENFRLVLDWFSVINEKIPSFLLLKSSGT